MKKIFCAALIVALMAGTFSASAAPANSPKVKKEKTEQCDKSLCDKAAKDKDAKCAGKDGKDRKGKEGKKHHKKGNRPDRFAGISLTPDQQTKLAALKQSMKKDKERAGNAKPTASADERKSRREAYNAKVKEILTPDQWDTYRRNIDKFKDDRKKGGRKQKKS